MATKPKAKPTGTTTKTADDKAGLPPGSETGANAENAEEIVAKAEKDARAQHANAVQGLVKATRTAFNVVGQSEIRATVDRALIDLQNEFTNNQAR